jgi:putative spermidine/putrescine transport system permease protein
LLHWSAASPGRDSGSEGFVNDAEINWISRLWLMAFGSLVLLFLIVPSFIVVPMSFTASTFLEFPPKELSLRWYKQYFGMPDWRTATAVSLQVAFITIVLATPIGTAAAYALHVCDRRSRWLLGTVIVAPMLIPHVLVAVGQFFIFASLGMSNTLTGLALSHAMLALPFVFILVSAGLAQYDMTTEFAARSLGASRLRAFLTVTLPQIKYSVIFSSLIAFITSFDEVIIAMFLATGPLSTLTRRMFLSLRDAIDPTIAAISTILILLSVVVVIAAQLAGQHQGGGQRRL